MHISLNISEYNLVRKIKNLKFVWYNSLMKCTDASNFYTILTAHK